MATEKKALKNKTPSQQTPQKRKRARNGDLSTSMLFWLIFVVALIGWGVMFSREFTKFDAITDLAEDQLFALRPKGLVLGLDDGTGETAIGDETVAAEEGVAEGEDGTKADAVVDEIEEERKENLRSTLFLELPEETDNPNHPVTFTEPTEEGVEIQVDGDGFSQKKSPYALPSLSIGVHTINFRFLDEDEVTQNLEEKIVVIPRAPTWDEGHETEFNSGEAVVLSGTALPRSKVIVLVSSELVTTEVEADEEGNWSAVISEELTTGGHTAVSFVRKEGYASNFSDPLEFTIGHVEGASEDNGGSTGGTVDSNTSMVWWDRYMNEDNYYLVIAGVGVVIIVVILLIAGLIKLIFGSDKKEDSGWVEDVKNGDDAKSSGSKLSLREKFAQSGLKSSGNEKEEAVAAEDPEEKKSKNKEKEEPDKKEDEPEEKKSKKEKTIEETEDPAGEKSDNQTEEKPDKKVEKVKEPEEKKSSAKSMKDDSGEDAPVEDHPTSETPSEKPKPGQVYSKDEFMEKFKESSSMGKETKKIKISLTSTDK